MLVGVNPKHPIGKRKPIFKVMTESVRCYGSEALTLNVDLKRRLSAVEWTI